MTLISESESQSTNTRKLPFCPLLVRLLLQSTPQTSLLLTSLPLFLLYYPPTPTPPHPLHSSLPVPPSVSLCLLYTHAKAQTGHDFNNFLWAGARFPSCVCCLMSLSLSWWWCFSIGEQQMTHWCLRWELPPNWTLLTVIFTHATMATDCSRA